MSKNLNGCWLLFVLLLAPAFANAKEPECKKLEAVKTEFHKICPDCEIAILHGCQLGISVPPVQHERLALTLDQKIMVSRYLEDLDDLRKQFEALIGQLNGGLRPADLRQQLESIRTDLGRTENEDIFSLYRSSNGENSSSTRAASLNLLDKTHFQIVKIRLSLVNANAGYEEFRADVKRLRDYVEEAIKSLPYNYETAAILR